MPPIDDNSSGHSPGQGSGGGGSYPYPATSFPQGYYTNANTYASDSFSSAQVAGSTTKYYPTGYPYPNPAGVVGVNNGPPDDPFPNNGRDLNYYGYNNGFGNNGGGGDGGTSSGFFASSSTSSSQPNLNPGDNNNKLSDSSVASEISTFGDTKVQVKLESSSDPGIISESSKTNLLLSPHPQLPKSDTTDNSDNQVDITRSHEDIDDTLNKHMKHSNSSPNSLSQQGLKRSLSPSSGVPEAPPNSDSNPNFEAAQNTMSALGSSEEYMRQQQMLGPDGKHNKSGLFTIVDRHTHWDKSQFFFVIKSQKNYFEPKSTKPLI